MNTVAANVKANIASAAMRGMKANGVFETIVEAAVPYWDRKLLARLDVHFFPGEIEDYSVDGTEKIIAKLLKRLKAERRRGLSGRWSYDMNRHIGIAAGYRAETRRLDALEADAAKSASHQHIERGLLGAA